jgi:type VI secretion system protein ImpF
MAEQRAPQQGLMPSMLDRLIDTDTEGTAWRHGYDIGQIIEAVRRDLEDLLNTRQTNSGIPEAFVEVHRSIVGFGLPDLSLVDASAPGEREEMSKTIEGIVSRYEPRLRNVKAILVGGDQAGSRTAKFHIEARLNVDPAPEVSFETVVELTSGRTIVTQGTT